MLNAGPRNRVPSRIECREWKGVHELGVGVGGACDLPAEMTVNVWTVVEAARRRCSILLRVSDMDWRNLRCNVNTWTCGTVLSDLGCMRSKISVHKIFTVAVCRSCPPRCIVQNSSNQHKNRSLPPLPPTLNQSLSTPNPLVVIPITPSITATASRSTGRAVPTL